MAAHEQSSSTAEGPRKNINILLRMFHGRPGGNATFFVFVTVTILAAFEMVPGWGLFGIDVSPLACYSLVGVAGLAAGFIGAELRLTGAIAGALCGVGAIGAIATMLSFVESVPKFMVVVAMVVGFAPGILIYFLGERLAERSA